MSDLLRYKTRKFRVNASAFARTNGLLTLIIVAVGFVLAVEAVALVGFFHTHGSSSLQAKSSNPADYPHLDGMPKATVTGPAENAPPALPSQEGKVNGHVSDPDSDDQQPLVIQLLTVKMGSSVWQTLSNDISFKQPNHEMPDETVARLINGLQARMPGFDLNVVQPGFEMTLMNGQLYPPCSSSDHGQ